MYEDIEYYYNVVFFYYLNLKLTIVHMILYGKNFNTSSFDVRIYDNKNQCIYTTS